MMNIDLKKIFVKILTFILDLIHYVDYLTIRFAPEYCRAVVDKAFSYAAIDCEGDAETDIQVHDQRFYQYVYLYNVHGLAESYVRGWWSTKRLDEVSARLHKVGTFEKRWTFRDYFCDLFNIIDIPLKVKDAEIDKLFATVDAPLYACFAGETKNNSTGFYRTEDFSETFDEAQVNKMKLIGDKLHLKPGMSVVDIGCGFGSLCKYIAENYNVKTVGYNDSENMFAKTEQKNVEMRLGDCYSVKGTYDRLIIVEMLEYLGHENYRNFFQTIYRYLNDDGIILLHTNGHGHHVYNYWSNRLVYFNAELPMLDDIAKAIDGLFVIEDIHNFGYHYKFSLKQMYENFEKNWPNIAANYDRRCFRLMEFFFLFYSGRAAERKTQLYQIILTKRGCKNGYKSIR